MIGSFKGVCVEGVGSCEGVLVEGAVEGDSESSVPGVISVEG